MNVNIKTEVTETTRIGNGDCKVVVVNGEVTSITVQSEAYTGVIEFQKNFAEFERERPELR